MPYLVLNERLSTNQSGNKMWHSTETSLIYTTDKILGAIDQNETTAMVLLDMSKAFDGISHKTLLYKLQTYLLLLLLLIPLSLKSRHGELSIKYCIVLLSNTSHVV